MHMYVYTCIHIIYIKYFKHVYNMHIYIYMYNIYITFWLIKWKTDRKIKAV